MKITTLVAVSLLPCPFQAANWSRPTRDDATGAAADPIAELVETTFDARLVPALSQKAVDLTLRDTIKSGLDKAGESHGVRVGGAGGGWNFAVREQQTLSTKTAHQSSRRRYRH